MTPLNMAFGTLSPQVRSGTKTVTRRIGWGNLKAGSVLWAVEKTKPQNGDRIRRICQIEIVSIRKEILCDIQPEDVKKEGFEGMTTDEFVRLFCKTNKCKPEQIINRIEFKMV